MLKMIIQNTEFQSLLVTTTVKKVCNPSVNHCRYFFKLTFLKSLSISARDHMRIAKLCAVTLFLLNSNLLNNMGRTLGEGQLPLNCTCFICFLYTYIFVCQWPMPACVPAFKNFHLWVKTKWRLLKWAMNENRLELRLPVRKGDTSIPKTKEISSLCTESLKCLFHIREVAKINSWHQCSNSVAYLEFQKGGGGKKP